MTTERSFVLHAWFSKKHEVFVGSVEMDTPDGNVVRVTAIAPAIEAAYPWDDAAYMGVVLESTSRNRSFNSGFNPPPTPPHRKVLKLGEICSTCEAEYKERILFRESYTGCLC
jgi:hypothetical protein